MLQIRRHSDLGEESIDAEERSQLWAQNFERDVAGVPNVTCEVDRRHAALADLTFDRVAASQGVTQPRDGLCHEPEDGIRQRLAGARS